MTKAQARKRLEEARKKVVAVMWGDIPSLSNAELRQLNSIIEALHKAVRMNGLK